MFCPSALTSHSPTIPACVKPQTSVILKLIQSLSQTAVKTKESAAFSNNLAVFRVRRCGWRCTSALFTGAGISTQKSICRRALSSHHAAVSSIYSNYSFHHFWFTKKKTCEYLTWVFVVFIPPFGKKNPWMSHCGCDVETQHFQRFNSNVVSKVFFWWLHEVSCWYFDGKTLMFTAVANLLTIATLQTESREAIAFNSVSAYFRIGVLHFIKKNKNKIKTKNPFPCFHWKLLQTQTPFGVLPFC